MANIYIRDRTEKDGRDEFGFENSIWCDEEK